ncbi:hypothetical protein [Gemmata obscuriglobus]|nr:hypothetical protein [Gemmata obscuriglobus]
MHTLARTGLDGLTDASGLSVTVLGLVLKALDVRTKRGSGT